MQYKFYQFCAGNFKSFTDEGEANSKTYDTVVLISNVRFSF